MDLYPQKMNQPILSHGKAVNGGRNLSKRSFRANILKEHRENTGELLYLPVDRPNIGVKQLGNISLKQIRIGNINAA
ncbi:hypothetical protein SDC9_113183 [bioreactor metagenome]|uniref:Uncharacterized protein n=1 Tax=bioreactor metagenome TaxID=1076179 RepID=A0A645BLS3_9ZZZZ